MIIESIIFDKVYSEISTVKRSSFFLPENLISEEKKLIIIINH
jgi:hypothetical protein